MLVNTTPPAVAGPLSAGPALIRVGAALRRRAGGHRRRGGADLPACPSGGMRGLLRGGCPALPLLLVLPVLPLHVLQRWVG